MANQLLYGFAKLADLAAERVTTVGVDKITSAIQQSVDEHNRQINALLNLFVTPTTKFQIQYRTPTVARLQGMDENGRPRPFRWSGHYTIAFPLQMAALGWGSTYVAAQKMTVQEANDFTSAMISADMRWVRDHILAALYTNTTWAFTDDENGALTIQPLANGDAVTYLLQSGADAPVADTHFLAQADAMDSTHDPFQTIYDELLEHPENGGEVVCLVPTNLKSSVMALAGFNKMSDRRIQPGGGSTADVVIGNLGVATPGQVFGYHDSKVWLVEWRSLPNDYMIALTTDGDRPLAMREDPEPELRGFRKVAERNDHPFAESIWQRRAGFGAFNRVGAIVYRVGNASYAIPTTHTSPMA